MSETALARLHSVLTQLGLPTLLMPPSEESPFEQVLVAIDETPPPEGEPHRYVFQLFFAGEVLASQRAEAGVPEPDEAETAILQALINLPIHAEPEQVLPLYRLLSVFNRILPVGAFELNEDDQVYLRYGLLAERQADITLPQVVDMLEMLGFFVLRFAPAMAELVYGGASLETVLAQAERELLVSALPESQP
ncbi:MAG: YbjN domain-containing protein [Candidatus Sericytochromatia bacterium]